MGWVNSAVATCLKTVRRNGASVASNARAAFKGCGWALSGMRNPKPTAQKVSFVGPLHNHHLGQLARFGSHGEVRSGHIRLALTLARDEKSSNDHNRVIKGSRHPAASPA
jgi:hypothetical protein